MPFICVIQYAYNIAWLFGRSKWITKAKLLCINP